MEDLLPCCDIDSIHHLSLNDWAVSSNAMVPLDTSISSAHLPVSGI